MAAPLRWTSLMLVFFLSSEDRAAAVDPQRLSLIVNGILNRYGAKGMFSLAVSVSDDHNQNINRVLQQVVANDPVNNVKNTITNGELYATGTMVAAKVLKRPSGGADHAEARVASHLRGLTTSPEFNQNNLMLFYVYASPCVEKCTNNGHRENILQNIRLIQQWSDHAFVFSTIFTSADGFSNTVIERSEALQQLGAAIGNANVFRCNRYNCIHCFSDNNHINPHCVSDETQTDTGQSNPMLSQPFLPQQSAASSSLTSENTNVFQGRGRGRSNRGGGGCRGNGRRGKRSTDGFGRLKDSDNCLLSPQYGSPNSEVDSGIDVGDERPRRQGKRKSKRKGGKEKGKRKGNGGKGVNKGRGRGGKGKMKRGGDKRGRAGKSSQRKSRGGRRRG